MLISEAFTNWEETIKPLVIEQYGEDDGSAMAESWNDYTDGLCKDGELSNLQYHYCPAYDDEMPGDEDEERDWMLEECLGIQVNIEPVGFRRDGLLQDLTNHFLFTISRNEGEAITDYFSQGSACNYPQSEDILYSVISVDYLSFQNATDRDDFCQDYGYWDEEYYRPTQKGLKVWEKLEDTAECIDAMFGKDELAEIQRLFEDY